MSPIKNYTSAVPIERTVLRIETALIRGGAIGIMKDYSGHGQLESISFKIPSPETRLIAVRLPADVEAVFGVMLATRKRPQAVQRDRLHAQAERTAWKLVQDWVEVQMAMIKMRQAELIQVFLPYVWDGRRTFFQLLKEDHYKLLMAPKAAKE